MSIPRSTVTNNNICSKTGSYRKLAQNRWKILSQSLISVSSEDQAAIWKQDSSTRHFRVFDLIEFEPLENTEFSSMVDLFQCSATIGKETYFVNIQIPRGRITLPQISGFNNTGNVGVWATEEVMAYYGLSNLNIFHGKRVLELGGGMCCLAGVMIAKYSSASRVCLTDGNVSSVANVQTVVGTNDLDQENVSCCILEWDKARKVRGKYDVVLSADCLFFDEARNDLVEAVWTLLADDGLAIVMAPLRGDTLHKFVALAEGRGFRCVTRHNYNDLVWSRHLLLKETPEYTENNQYPILLELYK